MAAELMLNRLLQMLNLIGHLLAEPYLCSVHDRRHVTLDSFGHAPLEARKRLLIFG